jgi:hypothetical protein
VIPRRVLWCVPALLALHNLEEAVALRAMLPGLPARAPAAARPLLASISYGAYLWALAAATLLPAAVAAWAAWRPGPRAEWAVAALQATVALNVFSHLGGAAALGGYAPGLATALAVNAPFSVYFFRHAAREQWLGPRALWATLPAALLAHGPGVWGLLALGRAAARAAG